MVWDPPPVCLSPVFRELYCPELYCPELACRPEPASRHLAWRPEPLCPDLERARRAAADVRLAAADVRLAAGDARLAAGDLRRGRLDIRADAPQVPGRERVCGRECCSKAGKRARPVPDSDDTRGQPRDMALEEAGIR